MKALAVPRTVDASSWTSQIVCNAQAMGHGVYIVRYTPEAVGEFTLYVTLNGHQEIQKNLKKNHEHEQKTA